LLPSDSAWVSQYSTAPSSDLLVKIYVSTLRCFFIINDFIFHFDTLYVVSLIKKLCDKLSAVAQLVLCVTVVWATHFSCSRALIRRKKCINKFKSLKNKWHFTILKTITDTVILKKGYSRESCHSPTSQISMLPAELLWISTALLQRKSVKVKNKIVYYKEIVKCQHLIFWPESQRRIHCATAKPEMNQRVS
jgi:hypothetical protein